MIIRRDRPLANDHQNGPFFCKWSFEGTGLLQKIIRRDTPLTNDHLKGPASCIWSSEGTILLQMIIQRDRPLANDHPEGPASCKWSSGGTSLLQMIICPPCHPSQLCQETDSISRTFLQQFVLVNIFQSTSQAQAFQVLLKYWEKSTWVIL